MELSVTASFQTDSVPSAHMGDTVVDEQDAHTSESPELWDARTEIDIAVFIRLQLSRHPAPAESQVAADLLRWAEALERDGRARLTAAGVHPLRAL